ncbi:hypothetical protein [Kiloniella sp.]|uniref:hypothetical protein n=1 Tax=Kiloniella sp. TaxID=1938587 RepID=UPI003B020E65
MKAVVACYLAVFFFSVFIYSSFSFEGSPFLRSAFAADIKVCQTEKAKYKYRMELANLLLRKTEMRYGRAKIVPHSANRKDPSQDRCIAEL